MARPGSLKSSNLLIATTILVATIAGIICPGAQAWPKLFKKSQDKSGAVSSPVSGPVSGPISGPVSGPVQTSPSNVRQNVQPISRMNAPVTAPIVDTSVGPSVGKYYISGATTRINQFIMIKPGGNYELFSPNGMSLGSGVYSYSALGGSVLWQTGPMTSPEWNGNQRYEVMNGGRTESIRVQMQAYATCTR
ncbi:MAG: hypothetical protein IPP57_16425 [Candidatus Obscuribacter sp.]|nr:hypothetical protein [Candidatus Obscuribacter sp.]